MSNDERTGRERQRVEVVTGRPDGGRADAGREADACAETRRTGRSAVSAKVQDALAAGRPMSEDAEKVASSTEIQKALRAENEARLRAGL